MYTNAPALYLRSVFHTTHSNLNVWRFHVIRRSMHDGTHTKKATHSSTFETTRVFSMTQFDVIDVNNMIEIPAKNV